MISISFTLTDSWISYLVDDICLPHFLNRKSRSHLRFLLLSQPLIQSILLYLPPKYFCHSLRSGPHLWPELLLLINLVLPGSSCSNLPYINYFPLLKKKKLLHSENPLVPHYLECKLLSLPLKTMHNPAPATFSSVISQSFTSEFYTSNTLASSFPDLATNPSEHIGWCFPQPSIPSHSPHRQINTQPSRFFTFSVKFYLHLQVN